MLDKEIGCASFLEYIFVWLNIYVEKRTRIEICLEKEEMNGALT